MSYRLDGGTERNKEVEKESVLYSPLSSFFNLKSSSISFGDTVFLGDTAVGILHQLHE
jgi:hypothetical protein